MLVKRNVHVRIGPAGERYLFAALENVNPEYLVLTSAISSLELGFQALALPASVMLQP